MSLSRRSSVRGTFGRQSIDKIRNAQSADARAQRSTDVLEQTLTDKFAVQVPLNSIFDNGCEAKSTDGNYPIYTPESKSGTQSPNFYKTGLTPLWDMYTKKAENMTKDMADNLQAMKTTMLMQMGDVVDKVGARVQKVEEQIQKGLDLISGRMDNMQVGQDDTTQKIGSIDTEMQRVAYQQTDHGEKLQKLQDGITTVAMEQKSAADDIDEAVAEVKREVDGNHTDISGKIDKVMVAVTNCENNCTAGMAGVNKLQEEMGKHVCAEVQAGVTSILHDAVGKMLHNVQRQLADDDAKRQVTNVLPTSDNATNFRTDVQFDEIKIAQETVAENINKIQREQMDQLDQMVQMEQTMIGELRNTRCVMDEAMEKLRHEVADIARETLTSTAQETLAQILDTLGDRLQQEQKIDGNVGVSSNRTIFAATNNINNNNCDAGSRTMGQAANTTPHMAAMTTDNMERQTRQRTQDYDNGSQRSAGATNNSTSQRQRLNMSTNSSATACAKVYDEARAQKACDVQQQFAGIIAKGHRMELSWDLLAEYCNLMDDTPEFPTAMTPEGQDWWMDYWHSDAMQFRMQMDDQCFNSNDYTDHDSIYNLIQYLDGVKGDDYSMIQLIDMLYGKDWTRATAKGKDLLHALAVDDIFPGMCDKLAAIITDYKSNIDGYKMIKDRNEMPELGTTATTKDAAIRRKYKLETRHDNANTDRDGAADVVVDKVMAATDIDGQAPQKVHTTTFEMQGKLVRLYRFSYNDADMTKTSVQDQDAMIARTEANLKNATNADVTTHWYHGSVVVDILVTQRTTKCKGQHDFRQDLVQWLKNNPDDAYMNLDAAITKKVQEMEMTARKVKTLKVTTAGLWAYQTLRTEEDYSDYLVRQKAIKDEEAANPYSKMQQPVPTLVTSGNHAVIMPSIENFDATISKDNLNHETIFAAMPQQQGATRSFKNLYTTFQEKLQAYKDIQGEDQIDKGRFYQACLRQLMTNAKTANGIDGAREVAYYKARLLDTKYKRADNQTEGAAMIQWMSDFTASFGRFQTALKLYDSKNNAIFTLDTAPDGQEQRRNIVKVVTSADLCGIPVGYNNHCDNYMTTNRKPIDNVTIAEIFDEYKARAQVQMDRANDVKNAASSFKNAKIDAEGNDPFCDTALYEDGADAGTMWMNDGSGNQIMVLANWRQTGPPTARVNYMEPRNPEQRQQHMNNKNNGGQKGQGSGNAGGKGQGAGNTGGTGKGTNGKSATGQGANSNNWSNGNNWTAGNNWSTYQQQRQQQTDPQTNYWSTIKVKCDCAHHSKDEHFRAERNSAGAEADGQSGNTRKCDRCSTAEGWDVLHWQPTDLNSMWAERCCPTALAKHATSEHKEQLKTSPANAKIRCYVYLGRAAVTAKTIVSQALELNKTRFGFYSKWLQTKQFMVTEAQRKVWRQNNPVHASWWRSAKNGRVKSFLYGKVLAPLHNNKGEQTKHRPYAMVKILGADMRVPAFFDTGNMAPMGTGTAVRQEWIDAFPDAVLDRARTGRMIDVILGCTDVVKTIEEEIVKMQITMDIVDPTQDKDCAMIVQALVIPQLDDILSLGYFWTVDKGFSVGTLQDDGCIKFERMQHNYHTQGCNAMKVEALTQDMVNQYKIAKMATDNNTDGKITIDNTDEIEIASNGEQIVDITHILKDKVTGGGTFMLEVTKEFQDKKFTMAPAPIILTEALLDQGQITVTISNNNPHKRTANLQDLIDVKGINTATMRNKPATTVNDTIDYSNNSNTTKVDIKAVYMQMDQYVYKDDKKPTPTEGKDTIDL